MEKKNKKATINIQGWQGAIREMDQAGEMPKRRLPDLVSRALEAFERRLESEDFKPTLAEYLRLLQVEKELAQEVEGPREITVTWVEPESDCSAE
jgi:hypothetical protein